MLNPYMLLIPYGLSSAVEQDRAGNGGSVNDLIATTTYRGVGAVERLIRLISGRT